MTETGDDLLAEHAERIAVCAFAGIQRAFPNYEEKPLEKFKVFFGCYDWHSSVHSHFLLFRLLDLGLLSETLALQLRGHFKQTLTKENLSVEAETIPAYEVPYGCAWVLKLFAQLRRRVVPRAPSAEALDAAAVEKAAAAGDNEKKRFWELCADVVSNGEALESRALALMVQWAQNLRAPDRTGLHDNTAFGLFMCQEYLKVWERVGGEVKIDLGRGEIDGSFVNEAARRLFRSELLDQSSVCPGACDFLPPALMETALMARVLDISEFQEWFCRIGGGSESNSKQSHGDRTSTPCEWLCWVPVWGDPEDPGGSHLIGLNFSRAWLLLVLANHQHACAALGGSSSWGTGDTPGQAAVLGLDSGVQKGTEQMEKGKSKERETEVESTVQLTEMGGGGESRGKTLRGEHVGERGVRLDFENSPVMEQCRRTGLEHVRASLPLTACGGWMGDHWTGTFALLALEELSCIYAKGKQLIE